MTYRVWIAFGLVGCLAACSAGGAGYDWDGNGPQSNPGTNTQQPSYSDQGAPGSPGAPPSNTAEPTFNSSTPPSSIDQTYCVDICNQLVAHGCVVEGGCPAACLEYVAEAGQCSDEGLLWLACLVRDPEFDCFQDDSDSSSGGSNPDQAQQQDPNQGSSSDDLDFSFVECPDEFEAYFVCSEGQPTPEDNCSIAGGCRCDDDCDACICAYDGDSSQCGNFCGGGSCTSPDCSGCADACDTCLCTFDNDTASCTTACGSGTGEPCTLAGDGCGAGCGGDLCAICVCAYSGDTTMCTDYCL